MYVWTIFQNQTSVARHTIVLLTHTFNITHHTLTKLAEMCCATTWNTVSCGHACEHAQPWLDNFHETHYKHNNNDEVQSAAERMFDSEAFNVNVPCTNPDLRSVL